MNGLITSYSWESHLLQGQGGLFEVFILGSPSSLSQRRVLFGVLIHVYMFLWVVGCSTLRVIDRRLVSNGPSISLSFYTGYYSSF